jgi:DNA-binding NarL/FixJ family response regulator
MTSVLVVDDHNLFRRGVVDLLAENGFEIVGEAANGNQAIQSAEKFQPDIILMDLHMPECGGVEATRQLAPKFPILVLTVSDNDEDLIRAIQAGASGYVLKHIEPGELILAIKKVLSGVEVLSAELAGKTLKAVRNRSTKEKAGLSAREVQVLGLIANGQSNAAIGRKLEISEHTVKTYVERVFGKLDVHTRSEAAAIAGSMGLNRIT